MVAKREPAGAPKKNVFFDLQPEDAPGPSRTPPPRRLRGSFFDDFGTNFTISDQQKHYFGDHSLVILALIVRLMFDSFGIHFYDFRSTKALLWGLILIILALILMASDQ